MPAVVWNSVKAADYQTGRHLQNLKIVHGLHNKVKANLIVSYTSKFYFTLHKESLFYLKQVNSISLYTIKYYFTEHM